MKNENCSQCDHGKEKINCILVNAEWRTTVRQARSLHMFEEWDWMNRRSRWNTRSPHRLLLSTDHEILYLHLAIHVHSYISKTNAYGDSNNISCSSSRWDEKEQIPSESHANVCACVCVCLSVLTQPLWSLLVAHELDRCDEVSLFSSFCFNAFVRPFSINDIW